MTTREEYLARIFKDSDCNAGLVCWCQTCRPITLSDMRMVLCPICGNKRCPKATDHRNACTGSNEPGQPGSIRAALSAPERKPMTLDEIKSNPVISYFGVESGEKIVRAVEAFHDTKETP